MFIRIKASIKYDPSQNYSDILGVNFSFQDKQAVSHCPETELSHPNNFLD